MSIIDGFCSRCNPFVTLNSCLDGAAEIALLPAFYGCIGDIRIPGTNYDAFIFSVIPEYSWWRWLPQVIKSVEPCNTKLDLSFHLRWSGVITSSFHFCIKNVSVLFLFMILILKLRISHLKHSISLIFLYVWNVSHLMHGDPCILLELKFSISLLHSCRELGTRV